MGGGAVGGFSLCLGISAFHLPYIFFDQSSHVFLSYLFSSESARKVIWGKLFRDIEIGPWDY